MDDKEWRVKIMDYSAFNPIVWMVFIGACIVVWAAVKIFHKRNPEYPGEVIGEDNQ